MTAAFFALCGICLFVGLLVGGTGMGGILVPPALVLLSGLKTHVAMGTTLASFIPMDIAGCILFRKNQYLDSRAIPLSVGGALSAAPFALWNTHVAATFLMVILSCLVLFAGYSTFRPARAGNAASGRFWLTSRGLFVIGAATGSIAGLTGAGGPLLAIAWMVTCGLHPLSAVGFSMPYSLATAVTASCCNCLNNNVDIPCLCTVSAVELAGFLVGACCVRKMPVIWIRRLMGVTCIVLGLFLLVRTLFLNG